MKLNLYDFDDTIYHGNAPFHFFKFCRKRGLIKASHTFKIILKFIQYKTNNISYTEMSEFIFSGLKDIKNLDDLILEFWESHKKNIKSFYLEKKDRSRDIIISASPEFLIKPIAKELGVKDLIGSDIDTKTWKAGRPMCRGEQKVVELNNQYPDAEIIEAYGNSNHDVPYMKLAKQAYMVKGFKLYDFKTYKPKFIVRIWNGCWGIYHKNEEILNYLIAGGLTTLIGVGGFALLSIKLNMHFLPANIISWALAVLFAYFAYRWFVFHSKETNKLKEFIRFVEARLFTLVLDTALMAILISILAFDDVISKILVSLVVLVTNYLISKFFVFKKV